MSDLYECDGCGHTGTEAEVVAHISTVGRLANGRLKEPDDFTCWGAVLVGSETWIRYHVDGIHPMTAIIDQIADIISDHETGTTP